MSSKAAYFSAKSDWKNANKSYEEAIRVHTKAAPAPTAYTAGLRQGYCWALLQQGRFDEAKLQYEKAKETIDKLDKRFVNSNILGYFMAPRRVQLNKEFNMRLDFINVAKNSGTLIRVEGFIPENFDVISIQPNYILQNDIIELDNKTVEPFQDEVITLTVKATKIDDFIFNLKLIYIDDLGETRTSMLEPVPINVYSL